MKATLIFNPIAGPSHYGQAIEQAADLWRTYGWWVDVRPTQYAGHAIQLARQEADKGTDVVIAAGGDGTLGQVANGLAHSPTIMAPMPVGTGNSLAKELRLPRPGYFQYERLLDASEALIQGRVQDMDMVQTNNGQYWLLWAGAGADGYLVEHIEPRSKQSKRLGAAGYLLQSLYILRRIPSWDTVVEIDGRSVRGDYLLVVVSNCRLFAGGELVLTPDAILDDGRMEVWCFQGQHELMVYRYLLELRLGLHHNDPRVEMYRGREVSIHTQPSMPVHTDGEKGGCTPFYSRVCSGALRLLTPTTAPASLFSRPGSRLSRLYGFDA